MRIMSAPDIHGSACYCRRMSDIYEGAGAECLVLLGDILHRGPRNDLPRDYAPKEIIATLDPIENEIYTIWGNCDTEADQMVLDFPIMADYELLVIEGKTFYVIHGHVSDQDHLPPMKEGNILVRGHAHLLKAETADNTPRGRITVFDPGSVSISKGGSPHTYAMLVDRVFRILTLDGDLVKETKLQYAEKIID